MHTAERNPKSLVRTGEGGNVAFASTPWCDAWQTQVRSSRILRAQSTQGDCAPASAVCAAVPGEGQLRAGGRARRAVPLLRDLEKKHPDRIFISEVDVESQNSIIVRSSPFSYLLLLLL